MTLFCLTLIFTPYAAVRLGGRDAVPDFGYAAWFAMLFAAGMDIGLIFYGALEPLYHMQVSDPPGVAGPFQDGVRRGAGGRGPRRRG